MDSAVDCGPWPVARGPWAIGRKSDLDTYFCGRMRTAELWQPSLHILVQSPKTVGLRQRGLTCHFRRVWCLAADLPSSPGAWPLLHSNCGFRFTNGQGNMMSS